MFFAFLIFAFCKPKYTLSIDRTELEISGILESVLREDVLNECTITVLKKLIILEGIIKIESNSFQGATSLQDLSLPKSTLEILENGVFYDCKSLKEIIVPEGVKTIQDNVFCYCSSCVNLTLPSTLVSITNYQAFGYMNKLERFIIPIAGNIFSTNEDCSVLIYNKTTVYCVAGAFSTITIPDEIEVLYSHCMHYRPNINTVKFSTSGNLWKIMKQAFRYTNIQSITIPEGVQVIEDSIFSACPTNYLSLPSTLISVGEIFLVGMTVDAVNCTAITQSLNGVIFNGNQSSILYIPNTVSTIHIPKNLVELDLKMIRQNTKLMSVTIDPDHKLYEEYDDGIYSKNLTQCISYPGGKTIVTIPPECKYFSINCLNSIQVKEINYLGSNVTHFGYAVFERCKSFIKFDMPPKLEYLGEWCFASATIPVGLDFPETLTKIEHEAFSYATIPYINFSRCINLDTINYDTFMNSKIGEIILPPNLVNFGSRPFKSSTLISTITIPKTVIKLSTEIFSGCKALKEIIFEEPSSVTTIVYNAFLNSGLTSIRIPNSVTSIEQSAFAGCSDLKEVTFDEESKLETIGRAVFTECNKITSLKFGKNLHTVIETAFSSMFSLTKIEVYDSNNNFSCKDGILYSKDGTVLVAFPSGLTSFKIEGDVERIGNSAFFNCSKLVNLTFDSSIPLKAIGSNTFYGCTSLLSIDIPKMTSNLEEMCFGGCIQLEAVSFAIGSLLKTLGKGSFQGCEKLKSVTFGRGSCLEEIGEGVFSGCNLLQNFSFPSSLRVIGNEAFYGCKKLNDITFDRMGNLTTIGDSSFRDCSSIRSIYFPDGLQSLGTDTFRGCSSLKSVSYCGETEVKGNAFTGLVGIRALVSARYESSTNTFGGIAATVYYDADCMAPTGAFTQMNKSMNDVFVLVAVVIDEDSE